jgi:hypothetical protein
LLIAKKLSLFFKISDDILLEQLTENEKLILDLLIKITNGENPIEYHSNEKFFLRYFSFSKYKILLIGINNNSNKFTIYNFFDEKSIIKFQDSETKLEFSRFIVQKWISHLEASNIDLM